ncbi:MAG TPA: protein kinase [Bryobacteraceae bacterium]|jgi:serine/threonine-protein kinase|nr:protein kinase [Bryobacteraceae bacterium]
MDFEVGHVTGDYEILALLGAGGMGKVYKVRNTISERIEAMKVLLARLDEHPELVDRFSREIKVTASLDHPNIAALRTAHRIDNQLAMIMEYVDGSTLDSLMRSGAMPLAQVLEIVNQALSALAYAHSHSVVHRDIKPANIIVTPEGRVKLMDFGIARMAADRSLTKTGQMVGSLYYMSPEQVEGKSLDARSDLYSLGVTLYELVTSKKPFEGDSDYAILAGHLHQPPRPPIELSPGVPDGLNEIILMALAKDPNERFQTAAAFRGALNSVASELGIPLSAPSEGASSSHGSSSGSSLVGTASNPGVSTAHPAPYATAPPSTPPPMVDTVAVPPRPAQSAPPPSYTAPPAQPQAQYSQPQYAPPPVLPANPSGKSGKRALWMIAGALATLLILAGAVIYLPKLRQANANPAAPPPAAAESHTPTAAPQQDETAPVATPQTPSAAQAAASEPPAQQAAAQTKRTPVAQASGQAPAPQGSNPPSDASQPQPQPSNAQADAEAAKQAQLAAELQQIQDQLDLLGSRAAAVKSSLETLQRQQAAQGYGLRGDMVASQQRMDVLMGQAQNSIQRGDSDGAKKILTNVEREVGKLEKFLGR